MYFFRLCFLIFLPFLLQAQSLPESYFFSNDNKELSRGGLVYDEGFYSELSIDTIFLYFDQSNFWDQLHENYCDKINNIPLGKLALSPTRTYAPVIKKIFDKYRSCISGMIHCTGGGQTKILHFVNKLHIVKDNMFPIPPIFQLIKNESNVSWEEMYKVFNMGHRMELYLNKDVSKEIIKIAKSFNLDAQIIGYVDKSSTKELTIKSPERLIRYVK